MYENSSQFSLDDLRVDEEEVRPPTIFPLSIIVCQTEFLEQVEDIEDLKVRIKNRLVEKYAFKKRGKRKFKEGFLEFSDSGNILECFYAKEAPRKINFEKGDLRIHTERLRLIDPAFSVRVRIILDRKSAKVVLYGGSDLMINKALTEVNYCIRHCIKGGHRTLTPSFSKQEMNNILKNFGLNVEYIWIHPGESEKFIKLVEKRVKGEVKKVPLYEVHAKLRGYRITGSPITISLIEESGVYLREIQGRLNFAAGAGITTRVSATGKMLFYIPENIIPEGETIYNVAQDLYERVIAEKKGPRQLTIGGFFGEKS